MRAQLVSLPDEPEDLSNRIQQIVGFWNGLRVCGESGAATWEELERLEHEVTDCLAAELPDVDRAESLTACAMLRVAGCSES